MRLNGEHFTLGGEPPSIQTMRSEDLILGATGEEASEIRMWIWSKRAEVLRAKLKKLEQVQEPLILEVVHPGWEIVTSCEQFGTTIRLQVPGGFLYKTLPFEKGRLDGLMSLTPSTFVPEGGLK